VWLVKGGMPNEIDKDNLRYSSDSEAGYSRVRRGKGFSFLDTKGCIIKNKKERDRLLSLVIPPAWEHVWINRYSNGHLQVTGVDSKGRKQYIYHPVWNELREKNKIERILAFGKVLPLLRKNIRKDLRKHSLNKDKVTALALNIMEETVIRAGNNRYRKENNSYGLTTLRERHVNINGKIVLFKFIGKKGKEHKIRLSDRTIAKRLKQVMEIPGQEVFQYYNEEGLRSRLDSGDLNQYIQKNTKNDFTSKDFRTWYGTLWAFKYLMELRDDSVDIKTLKKNMNLCLDFVADKLGNTRAVCRSSYVCGELMDGYQKNGLKPFFDQLKIRQASPLEILTAEKLLLRFLEQIKQQN